MRGIPVVASAVLVLSALLTLPALIQAQSTEEAQAGFQIVVNAANPTGRLSAEEVSRLFLKKDRTWSTGQEVIPVDLTAGSAVRESFTQEIHGRSVAAIKSYWQKMIFSGREVPPPEKPDEQQVLAFVRSSRGAIGYVCDTTPLGNGIKVLRVSE